MSLITFSFFYNRTPIHRIISRVRTFFFGTPSGSSSSSSHSSSSSSSCSTPSTASSTIVFDSTATLWRNEVLPFTSHGERSLHTLWTRCNEATKRRFPSTRLFPKSSLIQSLMCLCFLSLSIYMKNFFWYLEVKIFLCQNSFIFVENASNTIFPPD